MSSDNNHNSNTGNQGANLNKCEVKHIEINQHYGNGQPVPQKEISDIFDKYKVWVNEEKEHSLVRKTLKKLGIHGKQKRKLKGKGREFSADELLNKIPQGVTSLVTGPAGSGKSTLAASTMVNWAESKESRYELVLYFSSLHIIKALPLHKQLWGEYSGKLGSKDTSKIYDKLLEMTDKILVIIDGLGICKM